MYLKECLEKFHTKIKLYVDMDGVLADYEVGKPLNFRDKRPLFSNIEKLEEVSRMGNVEIHILSVCVKDYQIEEKNDWLDKYAPFFEKDKRTIISRESNSNYLAKELKANYLSGLEKENNFKIVLIDDDNSVLWEIYKKVPDIIVYQDSVLRD